MDNQDPNKEFLHRNQRIFVRNEHQKYHHTVLKSILLIALMFIFVAGAYGFRIYSQASNALGNAYRPADRTHISHAIAEKKPVTVLLLGVDTGDEGRTDRGNSDTMILATVNPQTQKTILMSIPRDTLAEIYGVKSSKKIIQKINSAYNLGKEAAAMKSVEKLLGIHIDHYVTMDFHSLPKIVDAVDGITVDSPFPFSYDGSSFTKGKQVITGKQSLSYARMRYEDPEGDYGRQKRQRQVIMAIVKKTFSLSALPNMQKLLNSISGSMSTDLSFDDIMTLMQSYRGASKKMESDYLHGHSATINGLSYEIAPTAELRRVSAKMRRGVGQEPINLVNKETKLNKLNERYNSFDFDSKAEQDYQIYGNNINSEYVTNDDN